MQALRPEWIFLSVIGLVLVVGTWGMWYITQDDYRGKRELPKRPELWHRLPSGEYIIQHPRHRLEDQEGPTRYLRWGGAQGAAHVEEPRDPDTRPSFPPPGTRGPSRSPDGQ